MTVAVRSGIRCRMIPMCTITVSGSSMWLFVEISRHGPATPLLELAGITLASSGLSGTLIRYYTKFREPALERTTRRV